MGQPLVNWKCRPATLKTVNQLCLDLGLTQWQLADVLVRIGEAAAPALREVGMAAHDVVASVFQIQRRRVEAENQQLMGDAGIWEPVGLPTLAWPQMDALTEVELYDYRIVQGGKVVWSFPCVNRRLV
jgi:hypothetical protein